MFSIRCNIHVKSWKNRERPVKNNKIKPFISKYNLGEVNYLSEKYDWKKIEKDNVTISLNVLYA